MKISKTTSKYKRKFDTYKIVELFYHKHIKPTRRETIVSKYSMIWQKYKQIKATIKDEYDSRIAVQVYGVIDNEEYLMCQKIYKPELMDYNVTVTEDNKEVPQEITIDSYKGLMFNGKDNIELIKNHKQMRIGLSNHFLERYVERIFDVKFPKEYVEKYKADTLRLISKLFMNMQFVYYGAIHDKGSSNYYFKNDWLIVLSPHLVVNGVLRCTGITLYKLEGKQLECKDNIINLLSKVDKGLIRYKKVSNRIAMNLDLIGKYGGIIKHEQLEQKSKQYIGKNPFIVQKEVNEKINEKSNQETIKVILPWQKPKTIRTMDDSATWEYQSSKARKYCKA